MSIPFCEIREDDVDGLDITEYDAVRLSQSSQAAGIMTGNGGFQNPGLANMLIVNEGGVLLNNIIIQANNRSFNIYSNCDQIESVVGGPDENLDARFQVPEGGKLLVRSIATPNKLYGWSTVSGWAVNLLSYICTEDEFDVQSWDTRIVPAGWSLRGSRPPHLYSYKIFGSGLYGIKPGRWHVDMMTFKEGGDLVLYDFTGIQGNQWGDEVQEIELSEAQLERMSWILNRFPDEILGLHE